MSTLNKRALGTRYEVLALAYVCERGAVPVEKNFRCRSGEIDLIFRDGKYLVFAEVKYRADGRFGTAAEAVGAGKQRTICRVAAYYLKARRCPAETPVRFDVLALDAPAGAPVRIRWLRDAFSYQR